MITLFYNYCLIYFFPYSNLCVITNGDKLYANANSTIADLTFTLISRQIILTQYRKDNVL